MSDVRAAYCRYATCSPPSLDNVYALRRLHVSIANEGIILLIFLLSFLPLQLYRLFKDCGIYKYGLTLGHIKRLLGASCQPLCSLPGHGEENAETCNQVLLLRDFLAALIAVSGLVYSSLS